MIAGGVGTSDAVPAAELFDPATGTATVTGELNTPRYNHTATLLPNGKTLVVGGQSQSQGYFLPARNCFRRSGVGRVEFNTSSMTYQRYNHTATFAAQ